MRGSPQDPTRWRDTSREHGEPRDTVTPPLRAREYAERRVNGRRGALPITPRKTGARSRSSLLGTPPPKSDDASGEMPFPGEAIPSLPLSREVEFVDGLSTIRGDGQNRSLFPRRA